MDAATEICAACTLTANLANHNHILSANDLSVPDNLNPYINGNLYPTSTICIEIKQSLERLTKRFEEVLAHQQNIISQVALMLKKHKEAYAKTQLRAEEIMDRHKYALSSPIRSLPDDLLAVIFQFTSPNAAIMDQFPWIATRVCRQWRAVAHSNRVLWSELNLDSSSITDDDRGRSSSTQSERGTHSSMIREPHSWSASPEGELERKHHEVVRPAVSKRALSQALELSGSVPLTFSVDFPIGIDDEEIDIALDYLDMFIAQAVRWRNVRLHHTLFPLPPPARLPLPPTPPSSTFHQHQPHLLPTPGDGCLRLIQALGLRIPLTSMSLSLLHSIPTRLQRTKPRRQCSLSQSLSLRMGLKALPLPLQTVLCCYVRRWSPLRGISSVQWLRPQMESFAKDFICAVDTSTGGVLCEGYRLCSGTRLLRPQVVSFAKDVTCAVVLGGYVRWWCPSRRMSPVWWYSVFRSQAVSFSKELACFAVLGFRFIIFMG
ncbi:uncharacterized protein EV420DRAFT_1184460 [Desarmillaria tabescens]|uniref:F-box domain-containing protein n=1 Tax=Armillaria tabescens TaxID=1929756 RepID=A0AA39TKK6_ARMTA|nr:uncharacterized protein EV420DRAFT_1184460 [Desarmillaria tabescens]KAK0462387.1 hypothetical protein EV420DRAFT_1184460 [Desarmillaria tabescens]